MPSSQTNHLTEQASANDLKSGIYYSYNKEKETCLLPRWPLSAEVHASKRPHLPLTRHPRLLPSRWISRAVDGDSRRKRDWEDDAVAVEHFRPKSGWRQKPRDSLNKSAYFWLSYEWENLLFACDRCNDVAHKGNLFPLSNPSKRADSANPDVGNEKPLLINPYIIDPEHHIESNRDIARPRNKSRTGSKSIEVFGLDEDELMIDQRRRFILDIERFIRVAEADTLEPTLRREIVILLLGSLKDSAPWAAMIRSNFAERIRAL